jgi:phenylpropionate dioxygenase-like ring-hydroxylating dioxygenase large terminal subunit
MERVFAVKATEHQIDRGTAYERQEPNYIRELTEVGRATPMGELLRRYWHPVALSTEATDTPRKLRALGEDLILFRDKSGRPGLVYERCAHRGTNLFYGRVEEEGIRCCYHGWLYDVKGNCLDQACEPRGGLRRDIVRQPWYPLTEQYGLIFAYMGPPERKPVLPRYDILEDLAEGEFLEADGDSRAGGGPLVIDCNWFQHYENRADTAHVVWLHFRHSGKQFGHRFGVEYNDPSTVMESRVFEQTELGLITTSRDEAADGRVIGMVTEMMLPTLGLVPNPRAAYFAQAESIAWVLPIDDTHFKIFTVAKTKVPRGSRPPVSTLNDKSWAELTPDEHQKFPGDYEAQGSQGPITLHSEEHLATTDQGVVLLRRMFQRQLKVIAEGGDPVGVGFDEDAPPVTTRARRFLFGQE